MKRSLARLSTLCLSSLLTTFAGCSDDTPTEPDAAPAEAEDRAPSTTRRRGERPQQGSRSTPEGEAPEEALAIDPASLGRIEGKVLFRGEPPKRRLLALGTEAACTGHDDPPRTEDVVVQDGGLRDVFVYVRRGQDRWQIPAPSTDPVVLSQEGCLYVPHAVAVQTGQTLLVRNGDDTTHNVNMKARRNGVNGNYTQGRKQADLSFTFDRREHAIPFKCDIHPWMSARLYVQDHPWFSLTDASGGFAIADVPAGDYQLEAVHPELGELRAEITVTAGATATAAFSFNE